ncbi:C40 family peptidase [Planobispora takensis]|uniref:Glycoside hydrolase n=1 Tax=Planobispora takensis TaxID=1367882 RepID=A0A8J3STS6_9ACTN|nr:C40 family peptidase [Planobispora takensis]GIH98244.1 glycoside hydrolase [Planobispora takensis]
MHSVGRRRHRAAVVAGLACVLVVGTGAPVGALPGAAGRTAPGSPGPSSDEVAAARAEARARDARFGAATVQLAAAQARLQELTVRAEKLVELYNGELVKTARAQEAHRKAGERVLAAGAQVEQVRRTVVAIAAQGYGEMDPMMAMMADLGSATEHGYLQRASILAHMSGGQAETLRQLRDAREVLGILQAQAADAYTEQRRSAERAAAAKTAAEQAVTEQVAETRRLKAVQAVLEKRADQARSTAERLAGARQAALERARLARERARQEQERAAAAGRDRARASAAAGRPVPRWALGHGLSSDRGDVAADWALAQLGKPYVWAADGPDSFDCSGLTMRAWERAGVRLDHWTGTQWTSGPRVPLGQLRRGDLLFFGQVTDNPGDIHHVGMYIGRGLMIHAPQTGDVVRIAPIWRGDLVGATRPV